MRSDQLIRALTEGAILHMVRAEEPENKEYWMRIEPYRAAHNRLGFWFSGWGSAASTDGLLPLIVSNPELFHTDWVDKEALNAAAHHEQYIAMLQERTRGGLSPEEWKELVALEYVLTWNYCEDSKADEERYKFLSEKRHAAQPCASA